MSESAVAAPEQPTNISEPTAAPDPLSNEALDAAAAAVLDAKPLTTPATEAPPTGRVGGGAGEPVPTPAAAPAAVPAVAPEPPAESAPPAPPAPDPLAARVAAMFEKEAAARRELEAANAERARERAELEAHRAFQARLKEKPVEALQEVGWGVEELNRAAITGRTPEAVRMGRLEQELANLKAERERERAEAASAKEAADAEATQRAYVQDVIPRALGDRSRMRLLDSFADSPEAANQMVFNLMRVRAQAGRSLTPAEAAGELEAQLEARAKRAGLLGDNGPQATSVVATKPVPPAPKPAVTNAVTPSTQPLPPAASLSNEDLDAAAKAYLAQHPLLVGIR